MFSLLTLHFYCFYIYSLRLYQVWIYGLGEFLNLFRGLKYNPLKVCYPTYVNVKKEWLYLEKSRLCIRTIWYSTIHLRGNDILNIHIFIPNGANILPHFHNGSFCLSLCSGLLARFSARLENIRHIWKDLLTELAL